MNSAINPRSIRRSFEVSTPPSTTRSPSEMKSVDLINRHNPPISSTTYEHPPSAHDVSRSSHSVSAVSAGLSASSFSSIVSSPLSSRISFQTLTNFIPVSWSPRLRTKESAAPPSLIAPSSNSSIASSEHAQQLGPLFYSRTPTRCPVDVPQKRSYVSKEKQLEKLRNLLECNGAIKTTSFGIYCKKCDDEEVCL